MFKARLGEKESALLQWLAPRAPMSVGEVVQEFGAEQELARTTLLTMMERLRVKGYLKREKRGNVYCYSSTEPHEVQLRHLVRRFVEKSLGGSLEPFVAYLSEEGDFSPAQIAQLQQMVRDIEAKQAPKAKASKRRSGDAES